MAAVAERPTTVGEATAHLSRAYMWSSCGHALCPRRQALLWPSFFGMAPWRLPLWILVGVYASVLYVILFYMDLFLPRVPLAVAKKLEGAGGYVGVTVGVMVFTVLGAGVTDNRVGAACVCVAAGSIAGLVAFWVWLICKYGGQPAVASTAADSKNCGSSEMARHPPI
ncbi:hypothetical protein ACP4OV_017292 [Aristida adscensionis]